MIKNLTYGALAAGGVALAAAVALPLITTSSEPPTSCKVTLDANGGTFTLLETNVYDTVVAYSNKFGTVFNEDTAVTNYNYDLIGWTNATGVVSNDSPVLSDMTCYAKWERSAIQKFNLVNGKFQGSDEEGENYVARFPAAFYGTATVVETNGHAICFTSPTSGTFRISFDPQIGWDRICAKIKICQGGETKYQQEFGRGTHVPVSFGDPEFTFSKGEKYVITLDFSTGISAWGDIKAQYVFGIGLGGHHVKFDAGEYGTTYYYDDDFRNTGANLSTNLPFGYLPTTKAVNDSVSFLGWYSAKKGGVKIESSTLVGTNDIYYAHWKLPTYNYYVTFSNNNSAAQGRKMPKQTFTSGVAQALSINRYYLAQHKFMGWDTDPDAKNVVYTDGQTVTDIWDIPEGTCPLYAVWESTPGENHFTVSKGVTNFVNVAVSNLVTYVNGTASTPAFTLTLTNSATLRVSLDPKAGSNREGAKLTIYKQFGSVWSNVCSVTDFATTNTMYSFEAMTYRFAVTGASTSYGYVVGLGADGKQINYDPCGMDYANTSTLSKSLEFNWTTNTPYGYWPKLTSSKYGTHLGWFYNKDITDTNEVSKTESVVSNATIYAHWANQPYFVKFDGNGAAGPEPYVQDFYYDRAQSLDRNQFYKDQSRFLGWTTNSIMTNVVYSDGQVITNLCTIAGATNTLYAVWQETKGTNWYYVAGGMTNFGTIAVSQGSPTYFFGKGDTTQFMVTTTNVAKCRVALDPQEGFSRTGAKLTIDCAEIPTNKTEELEWENACTVTDLADKEVTCSFTTNRYYRFTVSGLASTTNGYVVSIGAEGARYIFDACGGYFADVTEKQTTTMLKFFNWTVGAPIGYLPTLTTNKYVHGKYEWHYTPLINETSETTLVCTTNAVVSGGDRIYAIWPDSVIVGIVFDWNMTATNVVFTNYYAQGATLDLYNDDYVRQPGYDGLGFLGWTTNQIGTLGWDLVKLDPVTTNSPNYFYAQWTDKWKTSRTGEGISIDGYFGTLPDALVIPDTVEPCPMPVVAIGSSAFTNCLFTSLSLPDTLTSIGSSAFEGCSNLTSVEIPEDVAIIGDRAFADCLLLKSFVHKSVTIDDEYATEGFLDDGFRDLGVEMLAGCSKLTEVVLPIGMDCIPTRFLEGCVSLTDFKTPYTVHQIYEEAFCGCTHLTNVVFTEIVNTIGSGAFKKCARLKFVSFIGDQPESVESDIFEKTPRNVLVRYLANMCTTAKDYCGGSWPALPALWPDAAATNSSKTLTWLNGKYPRRKVIFNHNDNEVLWKSTQTVALYHEGRVFGLLAPTGEEMNGGSSVAAADDEEEEESEEEEEEESEKSGFTGWYTQPMGGRKVGDYWVVSTASEGDSTPITVYAHWGEEESEGAETGSRGYEVYWPEEGLEDFSGFYTTENDETGGDDMFYYSASTFNGIVYDTDNNAITGTVEFVFGDATYPADGGMESKFKATVTWNTGRKATFSGVADAEGYVVASSKQWSLGEEGEDRRTVITKSGLNGWLIDKTEGAEFRIYAARNRTAQATEGAARTVVLTGLQATKGTWHVVLATDGSAEGEGAEFANGYSTLSITIANMGQATITGTLGDGTAVKSESTLIIGDGCCCLPVNIRPYGGKGGFSFMLWFTWQSDGSFGDDESKVVGLTGWDASMSSHPFTAGLELAQPLTFIDEKRYEGDMSFQTETIDDVMLTAFEKGTKWKIAQDESNPNRLSITYKPATGIFSGSFAVETDDGKKSATVSGVFTDLIEDDCSDTYHGYGTAVIKGEGSAKVEIIEITTL